MRRRPARRGTPIINVERSIVQQRFVRDQRVSAGASIVSSAFSVKDYDLPNLLENVEKPVEPADELIAIAPTIRSEAAFQQWRQDMYKQIQSQYRR